MQESIDKDLSNHTPMMQQYHLFMVKPLKCKHKTMPTLVLVY